MRLETINCTNRSENLLVAQKNITIVMTIYMSNILFMENL
jgi:hypothetical protein